MLSHCSTSSNGNKRPGGGTPGALGAAPGTYMAGAALSQRMEHDLGTPFPSPSTARERKMDTDPWFDPGLVITTPHFSCLAAKLPVLSLNTQVSREPLSGYSHAPVVEGHPSCPRAPSQAEAAGHC